jgi:N utilization substance protein B
MRILYGMEFANEATAADDYWSLHKVSDFMRKNATSLVDGVAGNKTEIDALIKNSSENWPLDRMSAVDRNILRIAVYELAHCPGVPTPVAVDEALEIAKQYSSPESVPFINGILGKVAKETRAE